MIEQKRIPVEGIAGPASGLKPKEIKYFRARTFKSGNSLALRLPAGLGLEPGVEMELRVADGRYYEFWPAEALKRKFAIDKVWGSATDLQPVDPDDRALEERPMWNGGDAEPKSP